MKKTAFMKSERTDPLTGVTIQTFRHPCGLTVHRIPKPKFSKKFAGILVPFGSIHNQFTTADGSFSFPAGTAHYLEHCVFSKEEEGGLLNKLSSLGASANAYTSHTHTMYYFTTVDHFSQAFELYFNAVVNPYLEEDRVEAERNVIIQELDMYQDDPENQCFSNMIESLYSSHPVRIDIGGTKESVKQIKSSHLKEIQKCFYTPSAVIVTIAGDIDEDEILSMLERCLEIAKISNNADFVNCNFEQSKKPSFIYQEEPSKIGKSSSTYEMDVTTESFLIGIKNPAISSSTPLVGYERVMNNKSGQLFFEMILGSSSEIFETLYAEGLINDSFGFQYVCEDTYSYVAMGGESPNPKLAARKLHKLLLDAFPKLDKAIAKEKSINKKLMKSSKNSIGDKQILFNQTDDSMNPIDFELQKRVVAGNFIRSLDSVEYCGMSTAIAELSGLNIFDYPEIYDKMELETVIDSMRFVCNLDLVTESFISKKAMVK